MAGHMKWLNITCRGTSGNNRKLYLSPLYVYGMYQVGTGGRCLEEIRGLVMRLGEEINEGDEPSTFADISQAIRKLEELKGYVTEYFNDRKYRNNSTPPGVSTAPWTPGYYGKTDLWKASSYKGYGKDNLPPVNLGMV